MVILWQRETKAVSDGRQLAGAAQRQRRLALFATRLRARPHGTESRSDLTTMVSRDPDPAGPRPGQSVTSRGAPPRRLGERP